MMPKAQERGDDQQNTTQPLVSLALQYDSQTQHVSVAVTPTVAPVVTRSKRMASSEPTNDQCLTDHAASQPGSASSAPAVNLPPHAPMHVNKPPASSDLAVPGSTQGASGSVQTGVASDVPAAQVTRTHAHSQKTKPVVDAQAANHSGSPVQTSGANADQPAAAATDQLKPPPVPGRRRALEKAARMSKPGWQSQAVPRRRSRRASAAPRAGAASAGARVESSTTVADGMCDAPVVEQGSNEHVVCADPDNIKGSNDNCGSTDPTSMGGTNISVAGKPQVPDQHRVDRMLVQSEYLRLQQLSGRQFTVDCFCNPDGTNAHCQQYYSPTDSFFSHDLVDQHCWINPPFNMITEVLEHYHACKAKQPDRVSAVFCLPAPRAANPPEWAHLVKGMQRLHVYRVGTVLFTGPNPDDETQRHLLPGIRHSIVIYYDPPRSSDSEPRTKVQLNVKPSGNIRLRTSHVMQVPITFGAVPSVALLDSGAEQSQLAPDGVHLSYQFAQRHGFQMKPVQHDITVANADGHECKVYGIAKGTMKIGQLVTQVQALVMDMDDKLDVIIGEAWLAKHKAVMDYGSRACMFVKRGRRYLVRCVKPRSSRGQNAHTKPVEAHILTLSQTKRMLRKRVWYCLVLVQLAQGDNRGEQPPEITDPRVKLLVQNYPTVFTDAPPKGGSQIQAEHECIPLVEGAKPTYRPMFRYSPLEMAEMEKQISDLLDKGYIEPSTSPYGAPVLFVKKPRSQDLRLVIDHRLLNKQTIRNKFPIPRIDDMLDMLSGAKVFSSVDLRQAFHQIKLVESDKPKTAFRTPFGHYQWVTLSMGLTNAPAVFQSVVNNIFRPYLGKFVVVYLDDICVFSKTEEEHMKHLRLVLDKLREVKLTIAWHKCHFFQKELLFVGHIVTADGVKADPAKITAVTQYPRPRDVHELRSFLGMTNYFRKFVHKYANITAPLTQLLRKDSDFEWTDAQQQAFEAVKQALVTAPVLKLPDWKSDSPFEITCDASYNGIAGVLMQDGHPVAYESRKLNAAERNYSPTELEMLAVLHCVKMWRCYIEGKDVHVYTDHKPNTTFSSNPMLTRRQARWAEELQSYNIQWHYKPGSKNVVADALSRHPVKEATLVASSVNHSRKQVKQLTTSVPFLDRVKEGYKVDSWFADPANTDPLTVVDGVYTLADTIVLPDHDGLRKQVMQECHDTPYSGHPGRDKTLQLVKHMFWWPTLTTDVTQYVKYCPSCQRNKSSNRLPAGLLQPMPVPGSPWQSISMDMVVDLPQTAQGYDSITVFVDRLTKMVHLAPCKKTDTAKDVAELFLREVYRHHGMPASMVTDRDPKFTSVFWQEVFSELGTTLAMSSAYHPQTDGNTERVNRVMEDMLRHFVKSDQTNWDILLPMAEFAINNSHHESVGATPFVLNYGRTPNTPLGNVLSSLRLGRRDAPGVKQYVKQLQHAQYSAKKCLEAAQQRQKAYADIKRRHVEYKLGDKVLLSTKNITLKMLGTAKLLPRFVGPFKIIGKINDVAYRLELPPSMPIHNVFHVSLLKEYHDDGRVRPPPPPELIGQELEYEVQEILSHRYRKAGKKKYLQYLVNWKGYGPEHNTWEPDANCHHCPEAVQLYWDTVEQKTLSKQEQAKLVGRKRKKQK